MKIYPITPVPKPRMTQRDRRLPKRPCVARYHAFKDQVRALGVEVPASGAHVEFKMPMPKSWSGKKKSRMVFTPHQQKPDIDNLLKALLDAVHKDDSHIWDIRASKSWSTEGKIIIGACYEKIV